MGLRLLRPLSAWERGQQASGPEDGWHYSKQLRARILEDYRKWLLGEGTNSNLNPIKGMCFGVFPSFSEQLSLEGNKEHPSY